MLTFQLWLVFILGFYCVSCTIKFQMLGLRDEHTKLQVGRGRGYQRGALNSVTMRKA